MKPFLVAVFVLLASLLLSAQTCTANSAQKILDAFAPEHPDFSALTINGLSDFYQEVSDCQARLIAIGLTTMLRDDMIRLLKYDRVEQKILTELWVRTHKLLGACVAEASKK